MCEVCTPLARLGAVRKAAGSGRTLTEAAREADWRLTTVLKKQDEVPIRRAAAREFAREEREVLARLRDGALTGAGLPVFDLDAWALAMAREIGPPALAALRDGITAASERIGLSTVPTFRPDDPRVVVPLRSILGKTQNIAGTTADRLTRQIAAGVAEGETVEQLAARVRSVFTAAKRSRATTIARTAGTGAFEAGQHATHAEAGIERRRWMSAFLPDTRAEHAAADNQEVGLDEPFAVGSEALMYPADPAGSAGNVVNCYCTVLALL